MAQVIRVLTALIRDRDRYLIGKRPAHEHHGQLWKCPGGKAQAGASDLETMRRELQEESALVVQAVDKPVLQTCPNEPFQIVFVPVIIEGRPVALEHDELQSTTIDEFKNVPLALSDRLFVDVLLAVKAS